jgi:hypothetical protein
MIIPVHMIKHAWFCHDNNMTINTVAVTVSEYRFQCRSLDMSLGQVK